MKYLIIILLPLLLFSCCKLDLPSETPKCIEDKICDLKKGTSQNPPASVLKYVIADTAYYYFSADCCDQFSQLFDENCNLLCAPDGGITGMGDGNCPVNIFTASNVTKIWEDN